MQIPDDVTRGTVMNARSLARHQLLLFVVCGLGWSVRALPTAAPPSAPCDNRSRLSHPPFIQADVGELRLIGFLLQGDTLGWQVSAGAKSLLSSVMFVGMFLGAWFDPPLPTLPRSAVTADPPPPHAL